IHKFGSACSLPFGVALLLRRLRTRSRPPTLLAPCSAEKTTRPVGFRIGRRHPSVRRDGVLGLISYNQNLFHDSVPAASVSSLQRDSFPVSNAIKDRPRGEHSFASLGTSFIQPDRRRFEE